MFSVLHEHDSVGVIGIADCGLRISKAEVFGWGGGCLASGVSSVCRKRRRTSAFAVRATADKPFAAAVQNDFGFFHMRGDWEAQIFPPSVGFCRLLSPSVAHPGGASRK
jgi:hypothetical protein